MKPILAVVLFLGALSAAVSSFAAPSIIPLPVTMQTRLGVFTLGPNVASPNSNSRATRKIFVDAASAQTGQYLAMMLSRSTGFEFSIVTNNAVGPVHNVILLTTANGNVSLGSEGYELTVSPDSVVIRATTQDGVFWGVQSLLQLFPPQIMSQQQVSGVAWTAPCVFIQDYPRFKWRGFMLDVSRHFVDKQEVEKFLDGLALHKLNTFHWHLADDHGWRLEIKSYPLLTATASTNSGAWRTGIDYGQNPKASTSWNSFGKYGGYYTQDDVKEVVAYAAQRHITVVPELEFPAHCSAALLSYPSLGCGNASSAYDMDNINYGVTLFSIANSWSFFTNCLTEVMNLFPGKYIHCGGDEVIATGDSQWQSYTPDANQIALLGLTGTSTQIRQGYQRYLSTNLCNFLHNNGREMVGWSEFEVAGIITNAAVMDWGYGGSGVTNAVNAANAGQDAIMAINANCYINYYEVTGVNATNYDPYFIVGGAPSYQTLTNVYSFEPIPAAVSGSATNHILGAQCNLWTEYVPSGLNMEYKTFPRACAMAELTWTPKAQKNFNDFTNRLVVDEQRLDQMGMNYNREKTQQIGSWGPSVSTSPTTVTYDVTPYINKSGEVDVSFNWTTGGDGLYVYSVALLENGVQVDIDVHTGIAGINLGSGNTILQSSSTVLAYYVTRLPKFHSGATYTIQASIAERGTSNSSNGKVFLPNWN